MSKGPTVKSPTGWLNAEVRTSCCAGVSRRIRFRLAPSCRLKDIRQRTARIERTAAALRSKMDVGCSSAARIRTFQRSRDNEQKISRCLLDNRDNRAGPAGSYSSSKESLDPAKDSLGRS